MLLERLSALYIQDMRKRGALPRVVVAFRRKSRSLLDEGLGHLLFDIRCYSETVTRIFGIEMSFGPWDEK